MIGIRNTYEKDRSFSDVFSAGRTAAGRRIIPGTGGVIRKFFSGKYMD